MVISYDEDGNIVTRPEPEVNETPAPKRVGKKKGLSHLSLAQGIATAYPLALAYFAGRFWGLSQERGWIDVTWDIDNKCDEAMRRDGSRTIRPILEHRRNSTILVKIALTVTTCCSPPGRERSSAFLAIAWHLFISSSMARRYLCLSAAVLSELAESSCMRSWL